MRLYIESNGVLRTWQLTRSGSEWDEMYISTYTSLHRILYNEPMYRHNVRLHAISGDSTIITSYPAGL